MVEGWTGQRNGALLRLMLDAGFGTLVTVDRNPALLLFLWVVLARRTRGGGRGLWPHADPTRDACCMGCTSERQTDATAP